MNNLSLAPEHYADLKKSGLSDDTIREAGIKSVPPDQINKKLGFNVHGLVSMYEIPFSEEYSRFRAFYEAGKEFNKDGSRKPKYLVRKESGNRLYIPPKAKPVLENVSIPLDIVEGEKKSIKGCQEGLFCIAIAGLWNWKVKDENKLIPDFDQINLAGRTIIINPDNDWLEPDRKGNRKNLKQAVYELAYSLIDNGAKVYWRELPQGELKGIDDYLCKHTVEELKKLPIHKVRKFTIQEMIDKASIDTAPDELQNIIKRIANIKKETERSLYINKLNKKTGVSKRFLSKEIKALNEKDDKSVVVDTNIIIAHPAYEINSNFISLGFRETVVIGETPTERNIYLIATDNSYTLHEKPTFQLGDMKIVFEERDRLLINIRDRWDKSKLINFIKNPEVPEGLYLEIKQILKEYIEFQKEAHYGLLTAWIIATYFSRVFHAFPFLFFYGKKQSGKSRVLDFLERVTFNAMKIKGVSVASIADSIDGVRGTFLNDQAESLSDSRNVEILGILADSYTIGGGKRRIVNITNKSRRIMEFETFSPKAFASIKEIDADLKDRCVLIPMLRATRDYPYPEAHLPIWKDLNDKLYKVLLSKWRKVRDIYQTTGEGVTQRVRELWKPIEAILRLECVPQEEMQAIRDAFLESMLETQAELSENEEELFEVLFEKLKDSNEGVFVVNEIAGNLKIDGNMTDKGMQTWTGRTISQLKLYDKRAGRKDYIDKGGKLKKGRAYSFSYTHVKDIYDRYHQTGGTGGNMVTGQSYQELTTNHLKNTGGHEVVQAEDETSSKPPLKDEVVTPKLLKNKDDDHLTTKTTCLEEKEFINLENEKVEVAE
jgi:hypothetical protein